MILPFILILITCFSSCIYAQNEENFIWDSTWEDSDSTITITTNMYEFDSLELTLPEIKKRIAVKAKEALDYNQKNGLSTNYCLLIDMGIHSGKYRLFVYDFEKEEVIKKALVSHGCGYQSWAADYTRSNPIFSNTPESHLSSLGKYKIGKRGVSNWGIFVNYKMHGLEKTNSNAFKRFIVLHSWESVMDQETFPEGTPEGWGCPAVSNNTMYYLDSLLKKNDKVLMWIYQ